MKRFQLIRRKLCRILCGAGYRTTGGYVDAGTTERAANSAGLTVGDYVEKLWAQTGESKKVIDRIAETNIFAKPNLAALEIGAGTGRYIEKVLAIAGDRICTYESYETDFGWQQYLEEHYPIISRQADGKSLSQTGHRSIDFIAAHGVFVYTPFLITMSYLMEMSRVAAPGAVLAADFFTEDCLTSDLLDSWLKSKHMYPQIVPADYVSKFLNSRGFRLRDQFCKPYGEGISKYLIFQREMA